ncbi:MAG: hypothetical protein JXA11_16615 [Phycisphaerae bacterium]|nr:hypothetical protein [Phycisphaerae bacterium]
MKVLQRNPHRGAQGLILVLTASFVLCAAAFSAEPTNAKQASELWETMRSAYVNSEEFVQAHDELVTFLGALPAKEKTVVAAAMMRRGDGDDINAAALELFGAEGLPPASLQPLIENEKRTWPQRVLIRTYYHFLRPEYETRLSEPARRELVQMLADRLRQLAKLKTVDYGEQRLLTHMIQAALSRYAGKNDVKEMTDLRAAMNAYAAVKREDDVLSESIRAWDTMTPDPKITTPAEALKALGHFNALVRQKAAVFLGSAIRKTPDLGQTVLKQLQDPRDEVRAAAAGVFSFALSYAPEKVIPAMVKLLIWDRGVIVQEAASGTLIAHSDEAQAIADRLLEELITRDPLPGPRRTTSILTTLSYLISEDTPGSQKKRLLDAAVANLDCAPAGALRALEALGPDARPAVGNIREYRDTKADRFTRLRIDRHVLMAIDPEAVTSRKN